jgi:hypothetical protein
VPLTLKAVNAEFARRGIKSLLARGDGYFYFWSGEAVDWLERTVRVPSLHALTIEQWVEQFRILKKKNEGLFREPRGNTKKVTPTRKKK